MARTLDHTKSWRLRGVTGVVGGRVRSRGAVVDDRSRQLTLRRPPCGAVELIGFSPSVRLMWASSPLLGACMRRERVRELHYITDIRNLVL